MKKASRKLGHESKRLNDKMKTGTIITIIIIAVFVFGVLGVFYKSPQYLEKIQSNFRNNEIQNNVTDTDIDVTDVTDVTDAVTPISTPISVCINKTFSGLCALSIDDCCGNYVIDDSCPYEIRCT